MLPSARLRILLDYRPALRERTGVGEYAHRLAAALLRLPDVPAVTLFSSSWKDRLEPAVLPGADRLDLHIPVRILNYAWHRLGWPPVETFGVHPEVAWSLHPLLMPARDAARVVTAHDLYFLDHPEATAREIRRDYSELAAAHAGRADAVIAISQYAAGQFERRLGVPPERITVCYPGAPAWRVREEPAAPGPILHIGTIEPRKNIRALIRAYDALRQQMPGPPPLLFAGRVATPSEVPPDADAGPRDRIRFLGYVSDEERMRLYREASMLVVPSADEGFGIPVLEAMTIGLPVVAAGRGSLPEVLGEGGLVVDPDEPTGFAGVMRRLLEDPVLRREQAARGVARASHFSWDRSAERLLSAFRDAVARRQARS